MPASSLSTGYAVRRGEATDRVVILADLARDLEDLNARE